MILKILIGILIFLVLIVIMGPRVNATPKENGCSKETPKEVSKETPKETPKEKSKDAPPSPSPLKDIGFNPISGNRLAVKPGMGNRSAVTTQPLPVDMPITFKTPNSSLPEFNDGAVSMTPYARLSEISGYVPSTPKAAATAP